MTVSTESLSSPPTETTRQAAERYCLRGWHVIPIPHRSKKNTSKGWEKWRIKADELDQWFPSGRQWNIGVLLGEPSSWLIDVDLDHKRAVELAPQYLPSTPLMFGRPGKPKSHYLYRVTKPCATKRFPSRSSGMIVEVRSTGVQTVFPPSTHESGEPIDWIDENQEPAEVDPEELIEAAKRLADAIKIELGEKAASPQKKEVKPPTREPAPATTVVDMGERAKRDFATLMRIKIVDSKDGSRRLFTAACRCVEHDLDDDMAVRVIQEYARRCPFNVTWSTDGILKRIRDAERQCQRGQAFHKTTDGFIALGSREPNSARLVLSTTRTLPTARSFCSRLLYPSRWQDAGALRRAADGVAKEPLHRSGRWSCQTRPSIVAPRCAAIPLQLRYQDAGARGLRVKSIHDSFGARFNQSLRPSSGAYDMPIVAARCSRAATPRRDRRLPIATVAPADDEAAQANAALLQHMRPRF